MSKKIAAAFAMGAAIMFSASAANAACKTYAAKATSNSAESAKWYVMETNVQQLSWGLWPGWVATGKVAGYRVKNQRYICKKNGGSVTCKGRATFCKIK